MTQHERTILAKTIRAIAIFYGLEMSQDRLSLTLDCWVGTNVPPDEIARGYDRFTKESKIYKFPSPAEIMSIIRPKADAHDLGVVTAAKVVQAVSKFGYCNQEEAFAFIGPAGVDAVRRFGGWLYICENLGVTIDVTTFQAQVREITKSEIKMNALGITRNQIGYEEKEKIESSKQMSEVLALIKPKEF